MKALRLSILGIVALILTAAPALAQTHAISATIPFDFVVAKQNLPAGEYHVVTNGPFMQLVRWDVAGAPGLITMYVNGSPGSDQSARLIFNRYGDRYFLSRVWMGTTSIYYQLYSAPAEIGLARNTKPEETVILAKLLTK
jgi:hypothetical protein